MGLVYHSKKHTLLAVAKIWWMLSAMEYHNQPGQRLIFLFAREIFLQINSAMSTKSWQTNPHYHSYQFRKKKSVFCLDDCMPILESFTGHSLRVTDHLNHKVSMLFWYLNKLFKLESDKQQTNKSILNIWILSIYT